MSDHSRIQWTDATLNPFAGCTKVSAGCAHCYALPMTVRLAHNPSIRPEERALYRDAVKQLDDGRWEWSGEIAFFPRRLEQLARWKRPRRVFVGSMSDLFHEGVDQTELWTVLETLERAPQHTFQILTKRPIQMRELIDAWYAGYQGKHFGDVYPHINFGVTACNQMEADCNIPELLRTSTAVRFVSLEPLLGEINLKRLDCGVEWFDALQGIRYVVGYSAANYPRLDWVIVGAETGPGRRTCRRVWVESIIAQCREAGVPCFVKQIELDGRISHHIDEWPKHLRVREFPR